MGPGPAVDQGVAWAQGKCFASAVDNLGTGVLTPSYTKMELVWQAKLASGATQASGEASFHEMINGLRTFQVFAIMLPRSKFVAYIHAALKYMDLEGGTWDQQ